VISEAQLNLSWVATDPQVLISTRDVADRGHEVKNDKDPYQEILVIEKDQEVLETAAETDLSVEITEKDVHDHLINASKEDPAQEVHPKQK